MLVDRKGQAQKHRRIDFSARLVAPMCKTTTELGGLVLHASRFPCGLTRDYPTKYPLKVQSEACCSSRLAYATNHVICDDTELRRSECRLQTEPALHAKLGVDAGQTGESKCLHGYLVDKLSHVWLGGFYRHWAFSMWRDLSQGTRSTCKLGPMQACSICIFKPMTPV